MSRALLLACIVAGLCGQVVSASAVIYYNQAQWQAAMSSQSTLPLTNVNFASSDWTDSLNLTPTYTNLQSQSTTAASDGMAITVNSGYGEPGLQNNSQLGHASNGVWTDTQGKYGTTTFNFADPIYGFGGDFDISGNNGLQLILNNMAPMNVAGGNYDGFIGLVLSQPVSSFMITYGDNGCVQSYGTSYVLDNFQLATDPVSTPEPNFKYAFAGLLIFGIAFAALRRS